jgi:uncharacterized membrane protein YedE/YeeE
VSAPLYPLGVFGPGVSLLIALAIGFAFGLVLERAGLGDARKLTGQFYLRDMTVLKVMFTAILTALVGSEVLAQAGVLELRFVLVPPTYLLPQLLGGLIFGVGFVAGGYCPGTSCVAASTGRVDGIIVFVGMLAGMLVFAELYPLLDSLYAAVPSRQTHPRSSAGPFHATGDVGLQKVNGVLPGASRPTPPAPAPVSAVHPVLYELSSRRRPDVSPPPHDGDRARRSARPGAGLSAEIDSAPWPRRFRPFVETGFRLRSLAGTFSRLPTTIHNQDTRGTCHAR